MSSDRRVAAMRTQVEQLQSRIPDAGDDALDLAIQAAEVCMEALKIVSEKSARADFSSRCNTLLDQADRFKAAREASMPPLMPAALSTTPSHGTGTAAEYDTARSEFSPSLVGSNLSNQTQLPVRQPSNNSRHGSLQTSEFISLNPNADSRDKSLIDLDDGLATFARYTSPGPMLHPRPAKIPVSPPEAVSSYRSLSPRASNRTFAGRILPVSTRELSTSEKVLLLKASHLNGCKFPPWEKGPQMVEFMTPVFTDPDEISLSADQMKSFAGWRRAREALPPPNWPSAEPYVGATRMDAHISVDLVQDGATDCSVIAGISAVTIREDKGHPKMLSNSIWPHHSTKDGALLPTSNGKYIARLNFNGCWRKVVIDDRLPVSKTSRMLHVIDRKDPTLLWPPLLEKAYLKVRGGYDFPGSSSSTDLWALIGWIPDQVFLQAYDYPEDMLRLLTPTDRPETDASILWKRLTSAFQFGDLLVTAGTGHMDTAVEKDTGLESSHNYAVLDIDDTDGEKRLLLKNPWSEGKGWQAARKVEFQKMDDIFGLTKKHGGLSSASNPAPKPHELPPGQFWISFDRLFCNFDHLYLNWNPCLFNHREDIHFKWDISPSTIVPTCLANHPQFVLTTKGDESIWILLSRHFKNVAQNDPKGAGTKPSSRISEEGMHPFRAQEPKSAALVSGDPTEPVYAHDLAPGYISLYVFNQDGKRVYTDTDPMDRGALVNSPQLLFKWDMPLESSYTVVVEQADLPPDTYTFTLTAFSMKPLSLEPAPYRHSKTKTIQSAWTAATAGGNTQSPTFGDNPQFILTVPRRTALAMLLKVVDPAPTVHVILLHGKGQRVHKVKNRDVIADSKMYRKHCAFADCKELDPGTYTIACSTFQTGVHAKFDLQFDSDVDCDLAPIPKEGAGRISMKLAHASFDASVSTLAVPIVPRTLTRVSIVAKFVRSLGPYDNSNLMDGETRIGSPIRVTIEKAKGPARQIMIASGNGDYSDVEAGVRTEETDLSPQMLYRGDMWLVVDRLAGPAMGRSEQYSVELFMDKPDGLKVGVWRTWSTS